MQKKKYTTPFAEFLLKDKNGYYNVRLGPKIYLVKLSLDFTPDFDKELPFGGFSTTNVLRSEVPTHKYSAIAAQNVLLIAMLGFKRGGVWL